MDTDCCNLEVTVSLWAKQSESTKAKVETHKTGTQKQTIFPFEQFFSNVCHSCTDMANIAGIRLKGTQT